MNRYVSLWKLLEMKKYIGEKKKWVSVNDYSGYEQPINAVGGSSNTGSWEDSPCPTNRVKKEIGEFRKMLRAKGIQTKMLVGKTGNIFCQHVYILVHPDDRDVALEIAIQHELNTRLFFACDK